MRSMLGFFSALALVLVGALPVNAAPKAKSAAGGETAKRSGKEISTDDKALDKQMDWEAKVLGPNTQKKIDLAKIQKLQSEELARRERQEKLDQVERDRKEREAAAAAASQRNVKGPSTRDVPAVEEAAPVPAKPVEKHDDAFVDKLLTGKGEKKKVTVSNDDVDQLLNKAKQDKTSPTANKGQKGKGGDTVDQLLATADKQATIKTTARKPNEATEPVSAEAAAREETLKAIAAAAAKAQEERARNKRPAVPDAAILRAQAAARAQPTETARPSASRAAWTDPFAGDASSSSTARSRGKITTATTPPAPMRASAGGSGRQSPSTRPSGSEGWQDPFDSSSGSSGSSGAKARPVPAKAAPAPRPGKHPQNWKDPFA